MTLQKAHLKLEMLGSGCASVKTAPVPNYDVFATVAFEQFYKKIVACATVVFSPGRGCACRMSKLQSRFWKVPQ